MSAKPAPIPTWQSLTYFGTRQGELLRGAARLVKTHLGATGLVHVGPLTLTPTGRVASVSGFRPQTLVSDELGFERVPISFLRVERELAARLADTPAGTVLTVDMGWGLQTASATANFEGWMAVAQELAAKTQRSIVSLYNRSLLIDEHLSPRCRHIRRYSPPRDHAELRTGCRRSFTPRARYASRSISGSEELPRVWCATTPMPTATPPKGRIRCGC